MTTACSSHRRKRWQAGKPDVRQACIDFDDAHAIDGMKEIRGEPSAWRWSSRSAGPTDISNWRKTRPRSVPAVGGGTARRRNFLLVAEGRFLPGCM
jgi:hypothetical protein